MRRDINVRSLVLAAGGAPLTAWRALPHSSRTRMMRWAAWIGLGTLAFSQPLLQLVALASETPLHSHIPLIPFIAGYLLFIQRDALPLPGRSSLGPALLLGAVSAAAAAIAWRSSLGTTDTLALFAFAYVTYIAAGGFLFLGRQWMARAAFPVAFLIFMVPLPDAAVIRMEDALVLASADVSAWMLRTAGVPLIREGTVFALPTIVLEVARECSGIRSTWVLFITSVVASQMFLKSPWRRILLVAFIIPLGVIRNGFRILVIGLLCVHVGPHMIDSVIHHRGGPIFFVLSLVPLFMLLAWLRRHDRAA